MGQGLVVIVVVVVPLAHPFSFQWNHSIHFYLNSKSDSETVVCNLSVETELYLEDGCGSVVPVVIRNLEWQTSHPFKFQYIIIVYTNASTCKED